MTTLIAPPGPQDPPPAGPPVGTSTTPWQPRTHLEATTQQLAAIDRFHARRRAVAGAVAASREQRLDAARRRDVLARQHEALVARTHQQLLASGELLRARPRATALLAHRNAWFLDRVAAALAASGLEVVARLDNGADAIGAAVAEQPDLLLVEDALAMVNGQGVLAELRQLSPGTRAVAQVEHHDRIGPLLDAGAAAVCTRRMPPADVALALERLVSGPGTA